MIKITIVMISVLSFTGCVSDITTQPCYDRSETLINNSGKDITLHSYVNTTKGNNPRNLILYEETVIKDLDQISKTINYCPGGVEYLDFSTFIGKDSLVIDYGDRTKSYSRLFGNEVRNPYRLDANEIRTSKKESNFVYILTPEDYANAIPKP